MESEKVKEIKKALEYCVNDDTPLNKFAYIDNNKCKFVEYADILTLINELESENDTLHTNLCEWRKENQQLRIANKLYTVELGKKDKKEYENLITDIRLETLKDFREKYKEALKEAVKGENVDCFVESLKIFDKTIEEKICDLK